MEQQKQTIWRHVNHRDLWVVLVAIIISGLAVNLLLAGRIDTRHDNASDPTVAKEHEQQIDDCVQNKQYDKLRRMIDDPEYKLYISPGIEQICYLARHEYGRYTMSLFDFSHINRYGFSAAAFITVLWLIFLRKIDIFEPEPLKWLLITLVVGMLASVITLVIHDLQYLYYDFTLTGTLTGDLVYCILGIGLREEAVKLIAFFVILKWSKQVNETVDYLIYASISALGFAFIENMVYFDDAGLATITTRAFSATLLHISLSAIAVSGIFYARHRKGLEPVVPLFLLSFSAAVVLHGLYDFFIFHSREIPVFSLYLLVTLIVVIVLFGRLIKNALNQSQFNHGTSQILNITRLFIYGMYLVLLSQYLITAWNFGPAPANEALIGPIILFLIQSSTLLNSLGYITIEKGKWYSLISGRAEQMEE